MPLWIGEEIQEMLRAELIAVEGVRLGQGPMLRKITAIDR